MSWSSVATDQATGRTLMGPLIFNTRFDLYRALLNGAIDGMTSDPRTLDILSGLVAFTKPHVVVEVGTYRGIGTAVLAETLRFHDLPGHVWTCDPKDYEVAELLERTELTAYVTAVSGTFEDVLPLLPGPLDFCYVDASSPTEAGLRLRYTKLALDHCAPGGIVVVDDAAGDWRGSKGLQRMSDLYLPHVRGLAVLVK